MRRRFSCTLQQKLNFLHVHYFVVVSKLMQVDRKNMSSVFVFLQMYHLKFLTNIFYLKNKIGNAYIS